MQKTVLISGSTSGIGRACAARFAADGARLIITGRRSDKLNTLADELRQQYKVEVLALEFDIRDRVATAAKVAGLSDNWSQVDILVNNAGLAVGLDPLQTGDIDDWERMIDTNVKGLLYLTRAILPGMIQRGHGHIINIGSIAGKEAYANGNVYCATKFAVDALTKGIRLDTVTHGIKVSQVAPGAVETEFSVVRFKGDQQRADQVYKGFEPLRPEDIADAVLYIANLPPHVNIHDLVIMPAAQASATVLHKNL